MTEKLEKLVFIYKYLDALYYFKDVTLDDHIKRNVLRYFFVLIDDLLKIIGNIKNELFKTGKINSSQKKDFEDSIKVLRTAYDGQYDTIRDKFAAHQQPVELSDIIEWWNEIDFATISIFYDYACDIKLKLSSHTGIPFENLQPETLDFSQAVVISRNNDDVYLSHDRLASTKRNTTGMVSIHSSHEKAQIISSVIELTDHNYAIVRVINPPQTSYKKRIFEIIWFQIICDTCSLIDNLYEDISNPYHTSKSLLQEWQTIGIKGVSVLIQGHQERDISFENQLKDVRNKLGAHIDQTLPIQDIYQLYLNLMRLDNVYAYFYKHANVFRDACNLSNRTRMYAYGDTKVSDDVTNLAYSSYKEFD